MECLVILELLENKENQELWVHQENKVKRVPLEVLLLRVKKVVKDSEEKLEVKVTMVHQAL